MRTETSWTCPLCPEPESKITRGSEESLKHAVANHITVAHEQKSALQSVDRARIECTNPACAIGTKKSWNYVTASSELALTGYDIALLSGMRISPE